MATAIIVKSSVTFLSCSPLPNGHYHGLTLLIWMLGSQKLNNLSKISEQDGAGLGRLAHLIASILFFKKILFLYCFERKRQRSLIY